MWAYEEQVPSTFMYYTILHGISMADFIILLLMDI